MTDEDLTPKPMPAIPGVVVTAPEDIPDADRLVAYEKHDRTPAGPLQVLEAEAARACDVPTEKLVARRGEILEHGALLQLEEHDRPFGSVVAHVVVIYDARDEERTKAIRFIGKARADARYEMFKEALNAHA